MNIHITSNEPVVIIKSWEYQKLIKENEKLKNELKKLKHLYYSNKKI